MGNLGKYQDIVTQAKLSGGVDNLIKAIEAGAVAKATPGLMGKGALLTAGVAAVVLVGKHLWDKYKDSEVAADDAKEQLKAVVEEHMNSDDVGPDRSDGQADADEGNLP